MIAEEKKREIYEAHKIGLSSRKAAEFAGVDRTTVLNYWRKAGLHPNFAPHASNRLPKETIEKIFEAYNLGMCVNEAAEYANVHPSTIRKYWKQAGLVVEFKKPKTPSLDTLLYKVFQNSEEELTFSELIHRIEEVEKVESIGINKKGLEEKIDFLVKLGFYTKIENAGVIKYKAGMPKAMLSYDDEA
ncbi:MAG: hypothetical protein QXQ79_00995 [Candidatus Nanoarchaeia archaeon]